jgi:hypothetical protein
MCSSFFPGFETGFGGVETFFGRSTRRGGGGGAGGGVGRDRDCGIKLSESLEVSVYDAADEEEDDDGEEEEDDDETDNARVRD